MRFRIGSWNGPTPAGVGPRNQWKVAMFTRFYLTAVGLAAMLAVAGCNAGHGPSLSLGLGSVPASVPMHRVSLGAGNETNYPAPRNLRVREFFDDAWITWSDPFGLPLLTDAYVYRNTENNFATATLLSTTITGNYFDYKAEAGVQYWYWVRYGDGTDFGPTASVAWPEQTTGEPQPPANPSTVSGPQERVYEIAPASLRATQAPILATDDRVQIGAVREPTLDDLDRQVEHDGIVLYSGRIQDGVTAETLRRYLTADALDSGYIAVLRFGEAPTIRIQKGATPAQIRETAHAVQLINYWLPADWKLELDLRPTEHESGQPDDGVIVVEFSDRETWGRPTGAQTLGWAHKWFSKYTAEIFSAKVSIDPGSTEGNNRIPVLVHELLHALGRGHADKASFPNTVMTPVVNAENGHVLFPLDQDALAAVYGVLGMTTLNADLAAELGPWTDASSYLAASLPDDDVQFGVAQRNGFAQAWAAGPPPLFPLADNPLLSGSASWAGRLLGYTPDRESVGGRMDMTISLTTMTGDLDFTDMEKWGAGLTVGAVGTGGLWNTGALSYDVRVGGNYLLRTGGDDGELTGAFFGSSHEAVGGVLYRTDLAAGFGGSRSGLPRPPTKPVAQTPVQCPGGTTVSAGQSCPVVTPDPQLILTKTGSYSSSSSSTSQIVNGVFSRVSQQSIQIANWGYWGKKDDDTLFRASLSASGTLTNGVPSQSYSSAVTGSRTGSNPVTGSAVWTGGVRGVTADFTRVTGVSRLEAALGAATIDVAFTDFDNGQTDMTWSALNLANGAFGDGARLSGAFYGDGHEGVAGKFNRDGLRGVFGALRQ